MPKRKLTLTDFIQKPSGTEDNVRIIYKRQMPEIPREDDLDGYDPGHANFFVKQVHYRFIIRS